MTLRAVRRDLEEKFALEVFVNTQKSLLRVRLLMF